MIYSTRGRGESGPGVKYFFGSPRGISSPILVFGFFLLLLLNILFVLLSFPLLKISWGNDDDHSVVPAIGGKG